MTDRRPRLHSARNARPIAPRGTLQADVATLHAEARGEMMAALVEDPRVLAAFADLGMDPSPEAIEARLRALLELLRLPPWPWLSIELDIAARAWRNDAVRCHGAPRPGFWEGRRTGILSEAATEAPLRGAPRLPALPQIDAAAGENEALALVDAWHEHARTAIRAVSDRRPAARRPSPATVAAIRDSTRWLARHLLADESILSIAGSGLDEDLTSVGAEDRRSWIRNAMRRAADLLATKPYGTLLATRWESKDEKMGVFALPSARDREGSGSRS